MDEQEIVNKLLNNEMKLYEIEKNTDTANDAVDARRKFIEEKTSTALPNIGKYTLDMETANKKNIENPIGTIQIPVGVAGPLKINGEYAKKEYYVPLATSEGALVASVNRGCSVITASNGAQARIIEDKMTRAPVIKTKTLAESLKIKNWLESNFDELKKIAETTTSHGKLVKIDPILIVGNYVYPRFVYSTGDSMGMNMVTIATELILNKLTEETDAQIIALSGNACVDKKPAAINLVEGRGKSVTAEVLIPKAIVESKLKTTADAVVEVNTAKNYIGSAISGSMGFNAHYANMIGSLFLATGQDEAHVAEGCIGITTAENIDDDLYFSVTLPDLPIATVGGGTRLETASECLDILGVSGTDKVKEFAEIVAVTVLAGELSLMGALAAGHLARAHKELGRG